MESNANDQLVEEGRDAKHCNGCSQTTIACTNHGSVNMSTKRKGEETHAMGYHCTKLGKGVECKGFVGVSGLHSGKPTDPLCNPSR